MPHVTLECRLAACLAAQPESRELRPLLLGSSFLLEARITAATFQLVEFPLHPLASMGGSRILI